MNAAKMIPLAFMIFACSPVEPPPCVADAGIFPCRLTCDDGMKNGDETDVDCGGHCPGCTTGKVCLSSTDCESHVCVNQTCVAPTCSDEIKNGSESDIDCGRHASVDAGALPDAMPCARCAPGKVCVVGDDCASGICAMNVCTPSLCSDGALDGQETDVDCGGPYCPACAAGKRCAVGTDCVDGTCFNNACK